MMKSIWLLVVCVGILGVSAVVAQVRLPVRVHTEGSIVPPISGWPNEPSGMTLITDYGFDDAIPYNDDLPIASTGWRSIYNIPPNTGATSGTNGGPHGWCERVTDNTGPESPGYALDVVYPVGMIQGAAPCTLYRYTSPITAREIYYAYWVKTDVPFDPGVGTGQKMVFLFNGGGGAGGQAFLALNASDQKLRVITEWPPYAIGWPNNQTSTYLTEGDWHLIEWWSNLNTGHMKMWLDTVLQLDYTDPLLTNTYNFDMIQVSATWGGCCSEAKTETDHWYFDHVHASARP